MSYLFSHLCQVYELGGEWERGLCLNARFLSDLNPFSQHSDLNLQAR